MVESHRLLNKLLCTKEGMNRLTISNALQSLREKKTEFNEVFNHGSLNVEIYKPNGIDLQKPHSRDEIYVIASGSGYFIKGESRNKFEQGEVLFVPAGVAHRFEDFTDNFSTWVFFYGPEGGENA